MNRDKSVLNRTIFLEVLASDIYSCRRTRDHGAAVVVKCSNGAVFRESGRARSARGILVIAATPGAPDTRVNHFCVLSAYP